jgi:CTP:molybdopterin cytidylyltransferase MocA
LSKLNSKTAVVPLILAAGPASRLGYPPALAEFEGQTALHIAVHNCLRAGLHDPVVVLGAQALLVYPAVPSPARVVTNRYWRNGMITSIRAGLRRVAPDAAFLLYPVDLPLLTPQVVRQVVKAYRAAPPETAIVSPLHKNRSGHPVIFAARLRSEFSYARTAREVVERDPARVKLVRVNARAIYTDFSTSAELRRLQRAFTRRGRRM